MRKWVAVVLVSMLIVSTPVAFANVSEVFEHIDYNIKIGDDVAKLQYPIFINDGRVYVSIRSICDKLGIPIEWNNESREMKIDIYNKKVQVSDKTPFKEDGVIPDEETALIIGKTILEKYAGQPMEYETESRIYYLQAEFIESENAWLIVQRFRFKNPNAGGGIDWADYSNVKLNKSTGQVMFINTYSTFKD